MVISLILVYVQELQEFRIVQQSVPLLAFGAKHMVRLCMDDFIRMKINTATVFIGEIYLHPLCTAYQTLHYVLLQRWILQAKKLFACPILDFYRDI